MPFDRKEYMKKYRIDNKEKIRKDRLIYDENNKERILELRRKSNYQSPNHNDNIKKYNSTEKGIKSRKINSWKNQGLISDDYNEIYERYINCNNCEECNIELVSGGINKTNTKVMDHNHNTGEFRNVLCCKCNNIRN